MATIYRCDRCSRETKDEDEIGKVSLPSLGYNYQITEDIYTKDLCGQCINQLSDWLKPLPKQG